MSLEDSHFGEGWRIESGPLAPALSPTVEPELIFVPPVRERDPGGLSGLCSGHATLVSGLASTVSMKNHITPPMPHTAQAMPIAAVQPSL